MKAQDDGKRGDPSARGRVAQTGIAGAAALLLVAGFGYVVQSMMEAALGLPPASTSFAGCFRVGAAAITATLTTLPATLTDLLLWRGGWLWMGLPACALYLVLLAVSLPRSPVRQWLVAKIGTAWSGLASLLAGLVLLLGAARLLAASQVAVRVQGLLTGSSAVSEAVLWLTAIVQAGDAVHLSRRYVGLLLALAGAAHLTVVYVRQARSLPPASVERRGALAAGNLAAMLLALAAICLPAQYALLRIAAGFPMVRVVLARPGTAATGLLLDQTPGWVALYDPGSGQLRMLAAGSVREIEPGPIKSLFPLRRSAAARRKPAA